MRTTAAMRKRAARGAQPSRGASIPFPVRGWNAQDPIAGMKRGDAYLLDNWIPRAGYGDFRKGCVQQMLFPVVPESLLAYRAGNGEEFFAVVDGDVYDATSSGSPGAALYTGLTSSRVQSINFANDAGVFMLCVNGSDTPFKYNGSAFSTNAITGSVGSITLDPTRLINLMPHKRRVFLQEKESLRVWYLDVNAIAGAAGLLDLGPVFSEGGALVGMGVWSGYATDTGPDAVAVFITDQGQAAVFRGNNPADANDWFHVGTYTIGKPLGQRAVLNLASDLIVITHDGAISIATAMHADRSNQRGKAMTSRIQLAFANAAAAYGSKFGWEAIVYPTGQLAIINVPTSELGRAQQFVQNTQTGAWCRFIGLNAVCWTYVNEQIFFAGTDGSNQKGVFRWDTGGSDNGTAIQGDVISAFEHFGSPDVIKHFNMIRPVIRASTNLQPYVDVLVDYMITQPANVPDSGTPSGAAVWGDAIWGDAVWTSTNPLRREWTGAVGVGYSGAARMRVVANPAESSGSYPVVRCEVISFELRYLPGASFG